MAVSQRCSNVRKNENDKHGPVHSKESVFFTDTFIFGISSLWWCAHRGRAGSLWENRQCLICYDKNTQLDQWVQILQSPVRCQAAPKGSSTGSEPVTHHIKITGESEAFFLSNHFAICRLAFIFKLFKRNFSVFFCLFVFLVGQKCICCDSFVSLGKVRRQKWQKWVKILLPSVTWFCEKLF